MKYLVLDTETGGIGPEVSLLSAYFRVLDENLNLLDELELFLKPNDGLYKVTAEALGINKIDLVEHEKKAITYREGGTKLFDFLQRNSMNIKYFIPEGTDIKDIANLRKITESSGRYMSVDRTEAIKANWNLIKNISSTIESTIEKLEPLGHNVAFDIIKIKDNLISEGSWLKYVSYRLLDTGVIGNYLKKTGRIPKEISGSLGSYCDHFKVDKTKAHDAKGDVIMTIEVFKEMLKL